MANVIYKYATIGLALALFLTTLQYWAWPVVDLLFVEDTSTSGQVPRWLPESWIIHHWEHENVTEAVYLAGYTNCTFNISKNGTNAEAVMVGSLLACAQEERTIMIMGRGGQDVKFETIPADFDVSWAGVENCSMESSYMDSGNEDTQLRLHIRCGG